jgi:hypothetical protein
MCDRVSWRRLNTITRDKFFCCVLSGWSCINVTLNLLWTEHLTHGARWKVMTLLFDRIIKFSLYASVEDKRHPPTPSRLKLYCWVTRSRRSWLRLVFSWCPRTSEVWTLNKRLVGTFLYIPDMYSKYTGMFLMTCSTFAEYQFGLQASTLYTASNHRCKETLHIQPTKTEMKQTDKEAVPWLRRLDAGLPRRRPGFDPGSVHVGFVVDKVALGQVFPRVLRLSTVNFIPPVLHYTEKHKKHLIIIFITGLHIKT